MHSVEIKQLMGRYKNAITRVFTPLIVPSLVSQLLERQQIPARIGELEAASTTSEEKIQELQRQEKQLLGIVCDARVRTKLKVALDTLNLR